MSLVDSLLLTFIQR